MFAGFGSNPFHPIESRHLFFSYFLTETSVSWPSVVWSNRHTLAHRSHKSEFASCPVMLWHDFSGLFQMKVFTCLSIAVENDRRSINYVRFHSFKCHHFRRRVQNYLCTSACSKRYSYSYFGNRKSHFKNVNFNVLLEIKKFPVFSQPEPPSYVLVVIPL